MTNEHPGPGLVSFVVYTGLGYLALAIHRWLFAPALEDFASGTRVALVLLNLLAGSWCFIRALKAAWAFSGLSR